MKQLTQYLFITALAATTFMSGCSDDDPKTPSSGDITETSVLLSVDLDAQSLYPFHFVQDATTGTADIANAQELLSSDGAIMVAIKDNFIYVNDYTGETFKKLQLSADGILTDVGSVPNLGVNGNPLHTFLDDNRILLTSRQTYPDDGVLSYQVINTSTMTETTSSTFAIPIEGNENENFSYMYANAYIAFQGKIYIPYVEAGDDEAPLYDAASVAVFDATTFSYVKTISTSETVSLANGMNPSYATTESGDLYISSSNTSMYAGNESVPSGIVRIKSGETDFDDDYFFNVTEKTGFHSLGMLYVGNNKAIVQVFNSDVWDASDYYVEYYLADLDGDSMIKLDIPASRGGYFGGRRSMDLLSNGKAAILTNHEDGSDLYIYDPSNESVTQGTSYTGADAVVGIKAF
jgi:hypothetical protein